MFSAWKSTPKRSASTPTTQWYSGTLTNNTILSAATACPDYTLALGVSNHPDDGDGFVAGTVVFGVVRTTAGVTLGVYVGVRAPGAFVYPIQTHTLTTSTTANEVNVTQRMYDGTVCPRIVHLNAANATLSTTSFAVLIGADYLQITDVVELD